MDFRDLVDLQTYDLFESAWTVKEGTEAEIKADLASREKARETVANVLFASGLNDNIRDKACNMATKDMSSEEFLNVARRVEQTEKDKKLWKGNVANVDEVQTEDSDSDAEVNAVKNKGNIKLISLNSFQSQLNKE